MSHYQSYKSTIMAIDTVAPMFLEYEKQLLGFIRKRVGDTETSKDILNDILLKIYDHSETIPEIRNIRAWLYRVTKNAVAEYFRKNQKFTTMNSVPEPSQEWENDLEQQIARCVRPLIGLLPEMYSQPLIKSDLEGIPQQQIADEMGLGLSAVKSRIQRGRTKLRQQFNECCIIELDPQGRVMDFQVREGCKTLNG